MEYTIGREVDFYYDFYDYVNNVDLEYSHTEKLHGIVKHVNEENKSYTIEVNGIKYDVKEELVVSKIAEYKEKLNAKKIEIANAALKMRDASYGCDHPKHYKECAEKYKEKLYGLMSEYDEIEDQYIILGGEKTTY